jgi:hypothetical protein
MEFQGKAVIGTTVAPSRDSGVVAVFTQLLVITWPTHGIWADGETAFHTHMESLSRPSASAPSGAGHRVRSTPRSRHNPRFNRGTPANKAPVCEDRLRAPAKTRRAAPGATRLFECGAADSSFRGFADYMQASGFEAELQRRIKLARQKRSALCTEAVAWLCHRSLIADVAYWCSKSGSRRL